MARRYHIYDVFTDRALAGNPLAVVLDSEGLDDAAMQAVAREFNLSETVFVMPADLPVHTARVRIFTPGGELPFAGHPTVGTAICLAAERFDGEGRHEAVIVLEEGIGPVRCGVRLESADGFAEFDCPKLPRLLGEPADREAIGEALMLAPSEIGFENHVPTVWSAGVPFHFVPVRSLAVLKTAQPSRTDWPRAFGSEGAYLYTRETSGHDHSFRARMFAPTLGIDEDPATGAAAAAFAGAVHMFDDLPDGQHDLTIEQGYEMDRPSLIQLGLHVESTALSRVRIGGGAVRVASGTLAF